MKTKSMGFLCEFLKKIGISIYKSVSESKYDLRAHWFKILENPDTNIVGENRL